MRDAEPEHCVHCEHPITKDGEGWLHVRYSINEGDDFTQCLLYAEPKPA